MTTDKLFMVEMPVEDVAGIMLAILGIVIQLIELVLDVIDSIVADKVKNATDLKEEVSGKKNSCKDNKKNKNKNKKNKAKGKATKVKVEVKAKIPDN